MCDYFCLLNDSLFLILGMLCHFACVFFVVVFLLSVDSFLKIYIQKIFKEYIQ